MTISKKDLQDFLNALELQKKLIETMLLAPSVSKETKRTAKAVKPTTKVVNKLVSKETPKPTTKVVAKKKVATTTTSSSKGWTKFDMSSLPKNYTFMKITFKDNAKALFGRFLHTTTTPDKNIYIDILNNSKETIRVSFDQIKQVYQYNR
jgi:hypothetical protein